MAQKELQNQPLADSDYDEILHVGAVAEHDFLVYNSLASADLALSTPNPMMKIADVAGGGEVPYLEAAVGRPLEWDQVVPYFGRREIVKGSVYSYYEFPSPTPLTDLAWAGKPANPDADPANPSPADKAISGKVEVQAHPAWVRSFISTGEPVMSGRTALLAAAAALFLLPAARAQTGAWRFSHALYRRRHDVAPCQDRNGAAENRPVDRLF